MLPRTKVCYEWHCNGSVRRIARDECNAVFLLFRFSGAWRGILTLRRTDTVRSDKEVLVLVEVNTGGGCRIHFRALHF